MARSSPAFSALGDEDIRQALRRELRRRHRSDRKTVLVEELGLCRHQVRVDLAVVNGVLHGYEIKSDRDSLRRLASQAEVYGLVLDRVTLVAGERHLDHALESLPNWWGITTAKTTARGPSFAVVRRGRGNPGRSPRALAELLWLDESISLLKKRNASRGVLGKPRQQVWDRLCEVYSLDEIADAVRTRLKSRPRSSTLQPSS